jgi:hypothetical protein
MDIPPHLMVGFPFALNHIPNFVLLFVLSGVVFLLEVDTVVIFGDMIDYCLVAHTLEDSPATDGTPAKRIVRWCFYGLCSHTYASLGC